jgi:hypothetical protein
MTLLRRSEALRPVDAARPRVLLIVGSGRSGSTLFERALGAVPGVAALGEVVHLWDRAVRDDELCGCGTPFHDCAFWSAVGRRAFGGWDRVDVDRLVAARRDVVRTRHVPGLLTGTPRRGWRVERDHLLDRLTGLLHAAQVESGARLLVDSSKMPSYAALLMRADVDLRCVHVVRDPRGVAWSMRKTVLRPEATGDDLMHRTGVVESSLWWSAFDAVTAALRTRGTPFMTVRYEDFVADPGRVVRGVLDFASMPPAPGDLTHIDGSRIRLDANHQVAGNPMRFRLGEVPVRADEEWRNSLTTCEKSLVGVLTAGLRHRYDYR